MKKRIIVVFDIGKTNKKLLVFDDNFSLLSQNEQILPTTTDEDGFECDDLDLIEAWIKTSLEAWVEKEDYEVVGVNFSTYGASLAFIDDEGKRLTPIYNYLKEVPDEIPANLFKIYDGELEFCRKTASPSLGVMLNSGIQILWLKQENPEVFNKIAGILHFPQYLSFLLTKKLVSESTSIGCHTFLWDFDENKYHEWLFDEGINLPIPIPNKVTIPVSIKDTSVKVGVGIHDSSAALVPYLSEVKEAFMLISTGTWCINLNPFNDSALTASQLKSDCLSFLSVDQKPVKASRLFMGYIHDVNTERLTDFFKVDEKKYKDVAISKTLLNKYLLDKSDVVFFNNGVPSSYIDDDVDLALFASFEEAYHRLMFDITLLAKESIDLIITDDIQKIFISGGFARNEIFIWLLAEFYDEKAILTSTIDNASALGAALAIKNVFGENYKINLDLGLKEI